MATGLLIASVDELQGSTARITNHLDRLQTVEKDLAALRTASAGKDDVGKVRAEVKKDYVSFDKRRVALPIGTRQIAASF